MAGRDFASVKASSRRKPGRKKAKQPSTSPVMLVITLMLMALCFALGLWVGKGQGTVRVETDHAAEQRLQLELEARDRTIEALQQENQALKQKLQGGQNDVGELTFYSELPRQSVTPAPLSESRTEAAPKADIRKKDEVSHLIEHELAKPEAGSTRYHIQLGSFRKKSDATSLLQRVQKTHVSAYVQAVDLGEKGRWYRVMAGPFHSRLLADHARERLERDMHLTGLVVRVRR